MSGCLNPQCGNKTVLDLCDACFDKYMTDIDFAKKIHKLEENEALK